MHPRAHQQEGNRREHPVTQKSAHPYGAEGHDLWHHRRCSHVCTSISRNHDGGHVVSGEKEQDADEAASLMLKEIDAKSFHNGHRLSLIPFLHNLLK